MPEDPWSDGGDADPPPRTPGWGCLIAAVVVGAGTVIVVLLAAELLGTALSGVQIIPT